MNRVVNIYLAIIVGIAAAWAGFIYLVVKVAAYAWGVQCT